MIKQHSLYIPIYIYFYKIKVYIYIYSYKLYTYTSIHIYLNIYIYIYAEVMYFSICIVLIFEKNYPVFLNEIKISTQYSKFFLMFVHLMKKLIFWLPKQC